MVTSVRGVSQSARLRPRRPVRLLLISPRLPESFWSFRWALAGILPGKRALNPPLGLATVAALSPANWQVDIVDENVEPIPLKPRADLIGICGMAVQFRRQCELLNYYRRRGYYVVAGGSYASLCPERYEALADTVLAGEAEYIWPEFCRHFERGLPGPLSRETGVVDLTDSPTPRFDLLQLDRYTTVGMQFSRGCPFRCEFCDIIVMFGRRPRTKNLEQISRELDRLRTFDIHNVFFVDDNLIGNKPKAKALLRFLADYQQRHRYAFLFGTEVSLNVADDDELLCLFRAANFAWLFIGIESPDEASLKETKKTQNTGRDMLASVHKVYRYGIDVLGGFIVGFDNDTLETFDRQYRFIVASGIQVAMIGLLTALPRTPLYERLKREGRLIAGAEHGDNTKPATNFVPKRMAYEAMVRAYRILYARVVRDDAITARIRNKTRLLRNPVCQGEYSLRQRVAILGRLLARGIVPGGPRRLYRFLRTTTCHPQVLPQVIMDWIAGLAMREYIKRYFGINPIRERRIARSTLELIRRTYAGCLRRGDLEVSLALTESVTRFAITLRGTVHPRFYTHAARRLEKLMRKTSATLSLRIDELSERQSYHLNHLLRRLSRYGDRVSLQVNDKIWHLLAIDLSAFHLVLEDGTAQPSASG
ncbi:MAG: radical SAM protein [Acidiferrobacterales bacterium]